MADTITRILGLDVSVQALETNVAEDAQDVVAFYAQPPAARATRPTGTILVVQADGKGVAMIQPPPANPPLRLGKGQKRTKKKEAIVTSLDTIAPYVRTPAHVRATLAGKAAAIETLQQATRHAAGWATDACARGPDRRRGKPPASRC